MGNSWTYCLELSAEHPLSPESLDRALEILQEYGYPVTVPGILLGLDGATNVQYNELGAVRARLLAEGGLLILWSHEDNLHLCVTPASNRIEIGVIHDLREDRPSDVRVAADLENIFLALCAALHPHYAYASDEWRIEEMMGRDRAMRALEEFEREVRRKETPRFLFWLNYFSADYLARIGEQPFAALDSTTAPHACGAVVRLSAYPWQARIALLGEDRRYRIV